MGKVEFKCVINPYVHCIAIHSNQPVSPELISNIGQIAGIESASQPYGTRYEINAWIGKMFDLDETAAALQVWLDGGVPVLPVHHESTEPAAEEQSLKGKEGIQ